MKKSNGLPRFLVALMIFFPLPFIAGVQDSLIDSSSGSQNKIIHIRKEHLIEDIRQIADIIESSHPDPYSHGGGRIKFHFRLHRLLESIPESGWTRDEFIKNLRPFLAQIGDQHTSIYSDYSFNRDFPGGVPFVFGVVENNLYVQVAFREADQEYFGSTLLSVEGITVAELVNRFKQLEGCENDYFALREFARSKLLFEPYLHELIPEWTDHRKITFELKRPSGRIEKVTRHQPIKLNYPVRFAASRIDLPKTDDSGFLCDFIDPQKSGKALAYLRVDHMQGYREAKEMALADGSTSDSVDELQFTPSATESFRALVRNMKERNTQTLVIDIRQNGGGNYMMAPILIYFLYGKDVLTAIPKAAAISGGGSGQRYSPLFFETHSNVTIEKINDARAVPLHVGDIDFARIFSDIDGEGENPDRQKVYAKATTFYREYQSGEFSGFYCPPNVLVLMTPWTSSSGLDMALFLYRAGAKLIGTCSAQAPNSWGNLLEWRLDNSGISGEVSSSFNIEFGDNPEIGEVLPVHYPLTYEKLQSFNFDINSEFLYAMDLLQTFPNQLK